MSRFSRKTGRKDSKISTASLPDIVFMMLFFFMVSATIRSEDKIVETTVPQAKELTAAEQRSMIKELRIGKPLDKKLGETFRIADGDRIIPLEQLSYWVNMKRDEMPEQHKSQMVVLLRADKSVDMGIISDVQQELRKSNARKVLYRTLPSN
ncbi:MAG: biopolymer transporter ExbD [Cyclobacteriaceae bacterium]